MFVMFHHIMLTFIFNYFPWAAGDVATFTLHFSLRYRIPSSCTRWIYLCCIHSSTQTHAHKSLTWSIKILFFAQHEESAERAESHDRRRFSFFFYRKYGRKTCACVGWRTSFAGNGEAFSNKPHSRAERFSIFSFGNFRDSPGNILSLIFHVPFCITWNHKTRQRCRDS